MGISTGYAQNRSTTAPTLTTLTEAQQRRMTPIVAAVQRNLPSVVNISAILRDKRDRKATSVGSGSVIHPHGYILTNAHVVENAENANHLRVVMSDQQELTAAILASIPDDDIAILRVQNEKKIPLPSVVLGTSKDLMVGETAIAIGNPVGLGHSATTGIISAVGRELSPKEKTTFHNIIQTDAAINPGNSGGPLLNLLGEQIGVNTAIRSDAQNVGFAISVDRVVELLPALLSPQGSGRPAVGIEWLPNLPQPTIRDVVACSVASAAGLQKNDLVVKIGTLDKPSLLDVLVEILEAPAGVEIPMHIKRGSSVIVSSIKIPSNSEKDGIALALALWGMRLAESKNGFVVVEVTPDSAAARAGVLPKDRLVRVGPFVVQKSDELSVAIDEAKSGEPVRLRLLRTTSGGSVEVDVYVPR